MTERTRLRYGMKALDWSTSIALALLLCAVVAVLLAPHALGWRYGILRSGSMSPAMPAGAAIVVAPAAAGSVGAGDVITFRSANNRDLLITHRVVEVTQDERGRLAFRTKGDANEEPDAGLVSSDRLIGRVDYSLPFVGKVAQKLHTKAGFFALMVVPTALIIAMELRELGGGISDLRRERKQKKTRDGLETAT